MIKYVESMVTFEELPTEVTLSLSISNCEGRCPNCHSPELQQDIGTELTDEILDELIERNRGISCVLLLGEGKDIERVKRIAERVRNHWKLRVALYSGRVEVESELYACFDYVKIGPYIEALGPLSNPNTNQRLYCCENLGNTRAEITYKFWKR